MSKTQGVEAAVHAGHQRHQQRNETRVVTELAAPSPQDLDQLMRDMADQGPAIGAKKGAQ